MAFGCVLTGLAFAFAAVLGAQLAWGTGSSSTAGTAWPADHLHQQEGEVTAAIRGRLVPTAHFEQPPPVLGGKVSGGPLNRDIEGSDRGANTVHGRFSQNTPIP